VDTESAPAARIAVVGAMAAVLAELIAEPMLARSAAAAWTHGGAALRNSTDYLSVTSAESIANTAGKSAVSRSFLA
jgi:hypothetical protein